MKVVVYRWYGEADVVWAPPLPLDPPPPPDPHFMVGKNEIYKRKMSAIFGTQTFGLRNPFPPGRTGRTPQEEPPDQSDHRGEKRNLPLGKSSQAIFGTRTFRSQFQARTRPQGGGGGGGALQTPKRMLGFVGARGAGDLF